MFNLNSEIYVALNLTKHAGSMLAQLIVGILSLRVETCRYSEVPHERICAICSCNMIEDESHFIMESDFNDAMDMLRIR